MSSHQRAPLPSDFHVGLSSRGHCRRLEGSKQRVKLVLYPPGSAIGCLFSSTEGLASVQEKHSYNYNFSPQVLIISPFTSSFRPGGDNTSHCCWQETVHHPLLMSTPQPIPFVKVHYISLSNSTH